MNSTARSEARASRARIAAVISSVASRQNASPARCPPRPPPWSATAPPSFSATPVASNASTAPRSGSRAAMRHPRKEGAAYLGLHNRLAVSQWKGFATAAGQYVDGVGADRKSSLSPARRAVSTRLDAGDDSGPAHHPTCGHRCPRPVLLAPHSFGRPPPNRKLVRNGRVCSGGGGRRATWKAIWIRPSADRPRARKPASGPSWRHARSFVRSNERNPPPSPKSRSRSPHSRAWRFPFLHVGQRPRDIGIGVHGPGSPTAILQWGHRQPRGRKRQPKSSTMLLDLASSGPIPYRSEDSGMRRLEQTGRRRSPEPPQCPRKKRHERHPRARAGRRSPRARARSSGPGSSSSASTPRSRGRSSRTSNEDDTSFVGGLLRREQFPRPALSAPSDRSLMSRRYRRRERDADRRGQDSANNDEKHPLPPTQMKGRLHATSAPSTSSSRGNRRT